MNKKYGMAVWGLVGCLVTAVGNPLRADETAGKMDKPAMMHGEDHGWDTKKLQKELELSDVQVANLEKIKAAQRDAMKSSLERHKQAMSKLEQQVNTKASDAEIEATLKEMKSIRESMRDQNEQFQNQREDILTPTQRAKMILRMREHMGKRMQKHMEARQEPMGKPASSGY